MCVWYSHCLAELTDADDLTLIPQLGRSKRDAMQGELAYSERTLPPPMSANSSVATRRSFAASALHTLLAFQARARLLRKTPNPTTLSQAT